MQFKKVNIAYSFKSPYPFDESRFLNSVIGEDVLLEIEEDVIIKNFNIGTQKIYATKSKSTRLNYQPDRGIFGLISDNYKECNKTFPYLKKLIFEICEARKEDLEYIEIVTAGLWRPEHPPGTFVEAFTRLNKKIKLNGKELRILGAWLGAADEKIDKDLRKKLTWMDVKIEPFAINPSYLSWHVIYRDNEENTIQLWDNLPEEIITLFESMVK